MTYDNLLKTSIILNPGVLGRIQFFFLKTFFITSASMSHETYSHLFRLKRIVHQIIKLYPNICCVDWTVETLMICNIVHCAVN